MTDRTDGLSVAWHLRIAQGTLMAATADRIAWIHEARDLGMTNQQIGDNLGITEAAVRKLIIRNPRHAQD